MSDFVVVGKNVFVRALLSLLWLFVSCGLKSQSTHTLLLLQQCCAQSNEGNSTEITSKNSSVTLSDNRPEEYITLQSIYLS